MTAGRGTGIAAAVVAADATHTAAVVAAGTAVSHTATASAAGTAAPRTDTADAAQDAASARMIAIAIGVRTVVPHDPVTAAAQVAVVARGNAADVVAPLDGSGSWAFQ